MMLLHNQSQVSNLSLNSYNSSQTKRCHVGDRLNEHIDIILHLPYQLGFLESMK